jgi:hypothetical protein
MPHVLRVAAGATLAEIQSALAGQRARQIALVFPLGQPCVAGTSVALQGLRGFCSVLEKEMVIIGGDGHLRACAVAAGFVAATSLEEWESTHPELPAVTASLGRGVPPDAPVVGLVAPEDSADAPSSLYEPYSDQPPEYVLELLEAEGEGAAFRDDDEPARADDVDVEAGEPLRSVHEHYEDSITAVIRDTGGVTGTTQPHLALSPLRSVPDNESGQGEPGSA